MSQKGIGSQICRENETRVNSDLTGFLSFVRIESYFRKELLVRACGIL